MQQIPPEITRNVGILGDVDRGGQKMWGKWTVSI